MSNTIYISGIIGKETSLIDVIRQFKSFENPTSIDVLIDSVGGFVSVGQSIYNYLRGLNIPVTTIAKNECYSIASYIYLAGDTRLIYDDATLMIHLPWASVDGDADTLTSVAKDLKDLEKDLSNFYASHTSIDATTITALLKNDTYLNAQEAVEMGFSTAIKSNLKAVAMLNNKEEENKEMTKTQKFLNAMNAFFNGEAEPVALVITDGVGEEINFSELSEGDEPKVRTEEEAGDKAVDSEGKNIDGERILPDGSVFVFEAGELIEIKPVEEEAETEEEVIEETVEASASEVEDEIDFEEILKAFEAGLMAKIKEENDVLKNEFKALKKLVGSEEASVSITNQTTNTNNKVSKNYLRN